MRTKLSVVLAGVSLLLAAAPVAAHHSFAAEFDAAQPITLNGTVTKMEWINPHAWIHVAVKKADGTVENWEVETGNPSALVRRGFTKNSLPPGTEIIVQGFRAKDGGMRANGRDLTFKNGKKLFVGSSGTGAPDERPESETR
jgi:WD40 repeat protein